MIDGVNLAPAHVIPAKAGIQSVPDPMDRNMAPYAPEQWTPACAGVTRRLWPPIEAGRRPACTIPTLERA
jgi:hypothetical protein